MRKILLPLIFIGLLATQAKVHGQRTPLYVDVNYTGTTETGSATQPFKTISAALNQRVINGLAGMVTDEEIIVRTGVYTPDTSHIIAVRPTNGGTNGFFFTLKAEAGVIIDGANLFTKKFAAVIAVVEGAQYVKVDGFEIRNQNNNAALSTFTKLDTVTLSDGSTRIDSIFSHDVKFGIQVTANSKHIHILNNKVHDMSWTTAVDPTKATPSAADLAIMRGVKGANNVGPINVLGSNLLPMEDILIEGNEVYDVLPGFTEAITVNGYVDGFVIKNNHVHDAYNIGIVAAGNYGWVVADTAFTTPANQNYARNGLIQGNTITNCESPKAIAGGIYCDGSQNVIVERNIVSGGQVGISVGNENHNSNSGGHIVRDNIIFDNSYSGFILGVGAANTGSNVNNVVITGNTLYKNNTGIQEALDPAVHGTGAEIVINHDITNLTVKNNIVYAGNSAKMITAQSNISTTLDYNLYYSELPEINTSNYAVFDFSNVGFLSYGNFAWYQVAANVAVHGKDSHSAFANPLFVNAPVDFHIPTNSPAANGGDPAYVVGANETDYAGLARKQGVNVDMGAHETAGSGAVIGAPSNFLATNVSETAVPLSWTDNSTNEVDFEIHRSLNATSGWIFLFSAPPNTGAFTDTTGLSAGTSYYYRIRARNSVTETSDWISLTVTTPSQVNILVDGNASDWSSISAIATASSQSITTLKVSDDATKLYILLEGVGIGNHTEVYINTDNNSNTGFTTSTWTSSGIDYLIEDSALYVSTVNGPGWNWNYLGTAGIEYGNSSTVVELSILKSLITPSSTITIGAEDLDINWNGISSIPSTGALPSYVLGGGTVPVPNDPSNLVTTAISSSQIDLVWTDNSNNEVSFTVERSPDGIGTWGQIAILAANSSSYSNTNLTSNTTYYYRVIASNNTGNSDFSNNANATTLTQATTTITVDGDASDWSGVSDIATASGQSITSMKVFDDATKIYILLEGPNIWTHTEVFINSDNNSNTGYVDSNWATSGADFTIEDSILYASTVNGAGWNWSYQGSTGIEYNKSVLSTTVVEISILKSLISPSATITVGAHDLNGNWDDGSYIPVSGALPSYTLSNSGARTTTESELINVLNEASESSVIIYPNPFTTSTRLRYKLEAPSNVEIVIYDVAGKMIKRANIYSSGGDEEGYDIYAQDLTPGLYTLSIQTNEYKKILRIVLE